MKARILTIVIGLLLFLTGAPTASAGYMNETWPKVVTPLLETNLYTKGNWAYKSYFFLYTPMHLAFEKNHKQRLIDFVRIMDEMSAIGSDEIEALYNDPADMLSNTNALSLLTFSAQFLELCTNEYRSNCEAAYLTYSNNEASFNADFTSFTQELHGLLLSHFNKIANKPAWIWRRCEDVSIKEYKYNGVTIYGFATAVNRIIWRTTAAEDTYCTVTTGDDFLFASLGSLLRVTHNTLGSYDLPGGGNTSDYLFLLDTTVSAAYSMLTTKTDLTDPSGFSYDKGLWSTHVDYSYSGYDSIEDLTTSNEGLPDGTPPVPLAEDDVMTDSSHFLRFIPFITSLYQTLANTDPSKAEQVKTIATAYSTKIANDVISRPTTLGKLYAISTFSSGHVGLYRYNDAQQQNTVEAYQLSGFVFTSGFYSMLPKDAPGHKYIKRAFRYMKKNYPTDEALLAAYHGNQFLELSTGSRLYTEREFKVGAISALRLMRDATFNKWN